MYTKNRQHHNVVPTSAPQDNVDNISMQIWLHCRHELLNNQPYKNGYISNQNWNFPNKIVFMYKSCANFNIIQDNPAANI
jgi:hypothetical protein